MVSEGSVAVIVLQKELRIVVVGLKFKDEGPKLMLEIVILIGILSFKYLQLFLCLLFHHLMVALPLCEWCRSHY
ncbi:non-ribosomal peptide synthetase [Sesbania bispinosa]|nr:non-ribosomal peptide synthetase [Sesbania bispinosa]